MIEEGYKRNIIDHVEIVDEIPEVNDLATDTEKGCKTSTESSILSFEDISKLFKGRNLAFVSTLSDDGSPI
jgi:hypothetical protein